MADSLKIFEFRTKMSSLKLKPNQLIISKYSQFELSTLISFQQPTNKRIIPNLNNMGVNQFARYVEQVTEKIYQNDLIGFHNKFQYYLKGKFIKDKTKIQERINYMKYMQESLKFKCLAEIDHEINKQWKRNPLMIELNNIWYECIKTHQFKHEQKFANEYKKHRVLISNVSSYYFKNSLGLLQQKKTKTSLYLYEDSSHKIIQSHMDWNEIYESKLLYFLRQKNIEDQQNLKFEFDIKTLQVNSNYLNIYQQQNSLAQTTQIIEMFSKETKIHNKIILLMAMRKSFLKEIDASSERMVKNKEMERNGPLQRDDVIDCMIYCIIKGQITHLYRSLVAMALLLQEDSQLLSKRGVDSYKTDLECAIQYIRQHQHTSSIKKQ